MGYRAPSAEEVYRYVFRLDRYSRSLTDGFSLSIIFVNDDSPVCQDLISHYFVDLCHRTADRIRIIFFSELPEAYFEDIARRMNSNSYSAERLRENGLLNQVIEEMPRFYRSDGYYIREEILNDFFEALHWRNYNEVDFFLSRISGIFGPRYADALYRLVRQHRDSPDRNRNIEADIHQLIVEMQGRTRRDRFRRMYDDHWRDLTPDFMVPIDAPERTRELSFDAKNNTAMPGVGESMRFAARLGIGRYVPCFVFFTDIGELTIDVFPVGNLSAHEAYEQIRYWIDHFYQGNQVSLNRWNQAEKDIISFINFINQPLTDIKNWVDKSERLWNELRSVAQAIVKLCKLGQETADYKPLINNLSTSSYRGDRILSNCRSRLESISYKREKHRIEQENLEVVINKLKTASISTQMYDEFLLEMSQSLTPEAAKILEEEAKLIKQLKKSNLEHLKPIKSFHQLFHWWGNVRQYIPSFTKFREAYKKQPGSHTQFNKSLKSKYTVFIASIFDLPFSDTQEIFLEKAKPLCDESDIDFSKYSLQLTQFFTQLHTGVPRWIDVTNLKISVLVPFQSRDRISLNTVMAKIGDEHPIHQMIRDRMTVKQKQQKEKLVSEFENLVAQCRDQVLTELIKLRKELLDVSAEEIEVYSACLRDMYDLRNTIEKELIDLASSSSSLGNSLRLVEPKDIKHFLDLLNEYREAINEFVYPYKKDRRVQQVNVNQPFPKIFELKLREDLLNTSQTRYRELEEELEETISNTKRGSNLLQSIQQMSETVIPKARLASEILKIKQAANPLERLGETLYELNDQELRIISNSIAKLDAVVETRDEVINIILAIVGLLPARELATHRQYASRPINLEVTTMTEQSKNVEVEMNFHAPVTGATGKNEGVININISEQKQTLAEVANEIQKLLKQLEETNPSATEPEQVAYVDVTVQPGLKQRTIAALRAGGETAIDEFFLENKYLKVGKAVVKAWLQPSS